MQETYAQNSIHLARMNSCVLHVFVPGWGSVLRRYKLKNGTRRNMTGNYRPLVVHALSDQLIRCQAFTIKTRQHSILRLYTDKQLWESVLYNVKYLLYFYYKQAS